MRFCLKFEIAPNKSTSRHRVRDQLSCKKLRLCSHLVPGRLPGHSARVQFSLGTTLNAPFYQVFTLEEIPTLH